MFNAVVDGPSPPGSFFSHRRGTVNIPIGGQIAQDFNPNSKGMPSVQARTSGTFTPEVFDALLKITDQKYPGYGYNQDRWRNWWGNEQANRDLQQKPQPDRVLSNGSH